MNFEEFECVGSHHDADADSDADACPQEAKLELEGTLAELAEQHAVLSAEAETEVLEPVAMAMVDQGASSSGQVDAPVPPIPPAPTVQEIDSQMELAQYDQYIIDNGPGMSTARRCVVYEGKKIGELQELGAICTDNAYLLVCEHCS